MAAGAKLLNGVAADEVNQSLVGVFRFQTAVPHGADDLAVQRIKFVPYFLKQAFPIGIGVLSHQHDKAVIFQLAVGYWINDNAFSAAGKLGAAAPDLVGSANRWSILAFAILPLVDICYDLHQQLRQLVPTLF